MFVLLHSLKQCCLLCSIAPATAYLYIISHVCSQNQKSNKLKYVSLENVHLCCWDIIDHFHHLFYILIWFWIWKTSLPSSMKCERTFLLKVSWQNHMISFITFFSSSGYEVPSCLYLVSVCLWNCVNMLKWRAADALWSHSMLCPCPMQRILPLVHKGSTQET